MNMKSLFGLFVVAALVTAPMAAITGTRAAAPRRAVKPATRVTAAEAKGFVAKTANAVVNGAKKTYAYVWGDLGLKGRLVTVAASALVIAGIYQLVEGCQQAEDSD